MITFYDTARIGWRGIDMPDVCSSCRGSGQGTGAFVDGKAPICGACNGTGENPFAPTPSRGVGGGGAGGCFPAGTQVSMLEGTRPIESICAGDRVLSMSDQCLKISASRVLKVFEHQNKKISRITFADGQVLRTTLVHSFKTPQGWKPLRKLNADDMILSCNGFLPIESIRQEDNPETVFNLIVEDDFTFMVDGFFAHSFTNFRMLRMTYWTVRAKLTMLREHEVLPLRA